MLKANFYNGFSCIRITSLSVFILSLQLSGLKALAQMVPVVAQNSTPIANSGASLLTGNREISGGDGGATSSKMKLKDLGINKKYQADEDITDPKLQADSGSLSRYSGKASLTYYGPMIGDLSAKDQPNPDARTMRNSQTAISGNVGLQYRLSAKDSIATGTGIKGIYPAQGFDGVETNTPFLSFSHTSKWRGIQLRQAGEFDVETLPGYTLAGEDYGLVYQLGSVYDIPNTRAALGLDGSLGYYHFKHEWIPADRKANNGSVSLIPNFKYNFNSHTQFMTSLTVPWIQPRDRTSNPHENYSTLLLMTLKQSAGVSYSFTRDIYIYPYLNFYPQKLNLDLTTINVSTIFSIL